MELLQLREQRGQLGTEHMGVDGLQQGIPEASGLMKGTAKFGFIGFIPPIINFQGSKRFVIWQVLSAEGS